MTRTRLPALAFSALSFLACVAAAPAAMAADYPSRSMELVVAYQPGGGSDNTARAIAEAVRPPCWRNRPWSSTSPAPAARSAGRTWPTPSPTATSWC
ncbi:hypothetical protein WJ972_07660 [Achromobacter insuavis]